jgi:hypothetical protein
VKNLGEIPFFEIQFCILHPNALIGGTPLQQMASAMEQRALKFVNNCLYTNIYSYLETSGGVSYNPYLNVVHFFNTGVN